jgi:hypothetical protein|tara:strand:- start:319 stop:864 length:546 start_codon:yes stop_codon:yes gene_type:complete
MKKYAIIIGENNGELSRQVQEALFKVGFAWNIRGSVSHTKSLVIYLNDDGDIGEMLFDYADRRGVYGVTGCDEVLAPSYVLANAHELDGAKKPWEIPPKGYRLVTDEEMSKYKKPPRWMYYRKSVSDEWSAPSKQFTMSELWFSRLSAYAVPTSYTFEEEVVEVTMAELEAKYGAKVKVVK